MSLLLNSDEAQTGRQHGVWLLGKMVMWRIGGAGLRFRVYVGGVSGKHTVLLSWQLPAFPGDGLPGPAQVAPLSSQSWRGCVWS